MNRSNVTVYTSNDDPKEYFNVRAAYHDEFGFFNILFCNSDTDRVCIRSDLILRYEIKEQ